MYFSEINHVCQSDKWGQREGAAEQKCKWSDEEQVCYSYRRHRYWLLVFRTFLVKVRGEIHNANLKLKYYAISTYHHWCCEFESRSGQRDKVCQWLATGWWFSLGPPVSSINKTDSHDITEILLKVALNTIKQTNQIEKIEWVIVV